MLKKIIIWSLAATALICVAGGLWLYLLVNASVEEQFAGSCEAVELPGSGEDVQIDHLRGYAYISVFDRLGIAKRQDVEPGTVMRIDLNDPASPIDSALIDGPELRPHGLSLLRDATGRLHLIVINHPVDRKNGEERIERYVEVEPGRFSHQETFRSPLITRANDLVAVGPRQFYVAQDVDRGSGASETLLVYFDGDEYRVVADDIASGGGINVSLDLRTLYIAETGAKRVRIAELDTDGNIAAQRFLDLGTSPDNIDVAPDGSLWIGAHSNVAALAMHFIAGAKAPTQVLRYDPAQADSVPEVIYLNAGDEISAGSVGVTYGDTLLIGSITARKLLVCTMDAA